MMLASRGTTVSRTTRRGRRYLLLSLLLWTYCVLCLTAADRQGRPRFQYDLHPIAWIEHERRLATNSSIDLPTEWFMKGQSAIYATIPDPDDLQQHASHRQLLRDFHAMRHLSRYERQLRTENGFDLQLNWDGTYDWDADDGIAQNETTRPRRRLQLTSSSAKYGGKFDSYQGVPLSQGFGTHFVASWVGAPVPQRKTLIVDSGSHYTAFPCTGCQGCGAPHHTDPYFNPQKSKTFHALQCDECRDGVICDNGQCKFSQSYTEGSSWEALQVKDRFYCGGTDVLDSVDPNDIKYAVDFMFGCQVSMTGLFITQLADGIMGMSAHPATLPKQLFDRRYIEHNMFALCYRRELGTSKRGVTAGTMTLGGYSSTLDTSPMIYAKNMASLGWYTVYVKNIYVRVNGGQSALSNSKEQRTIRVRLDHAALNSGKGVIVDSGTTDTYLNKAVAKEFSKAWKEATGSKYSNVPIRLTSDQLQRLPTILVQCHSNSQKKDPSIQDYDTIPGYTGKLDPSNPSDLLIAIPATSYMDYSPITKLYTARVYFSETSGGVLGSNTMQGHNVVFDWENGRVGFAESSCTYDKKEVPTAVLDEGFAADCVLSDPILTRPCVKTVDQRLCKNNPTNIALLGVEVWSAVVESAGSKSGKPCIEVANEWKVESALDDPVITCDGGGICEEHRPCQLTCAQVEKAMNVRPSNSTKKQCGDSFWSACDYGCVQSKIVSVGYSDGSCREVTRSSRPCHIGACARSDPCRVPYLLHVVIGFRGASMNDWSSAYEEIFIAGLTRSAEKMSQSQYFVEGDVNVLAVLPWSADGAIGPSTDDQHSAIGLKIIMEIAMFNPLASFGNATVEEPTDADDFGPSSLAKLFGNFSRHFPWRSIQASCRQEDLFQVAKTTLQLKTFVIGRADFVKQIVLQMAVAEKELEARASTSPFKDLYQNDDLVWASAVLAVWSIQTEIDEVINYLGPPKPLWFRFLAFAHTLALVVMALTLLSTVGSLAYGGYEYMTDEANLARFRGAFTGNAMWRSRHRYSAASLQVPDDEDAIMRSPGGVLELTQSDIGLARYKGTVPTKRRSIIQTQDST